VGQVIPGGEPLSAITITAELHAHLRAVIKRSGLTYRQIEARAGELPAKDGWKPLPSSTLSEILNRRLPTHAQLNTLLRICRIPTDQKQRLLAAREEIAATDTGTGSSGMQRCTEEQSRVVVVGVIPGAIVKTCG
jgi:hypothetical protein